MGGRPTCLAANPKRNAVPIQAILIKTDYINSIVLYSLLWPLMNQHVDSDIERQ
jgi:hypothetical protein